MKGVAGTLLVPLLKIPLAKPVFDREMEEAAVEALRNERFVLGESVRKFEEEFAKYCGTDYAVSTNSGTDVLHIAQLATDIGPNRRVVTSPASFIATANAIIHANNLPVFSDINLENYTLDSEMLSKAVCAKTKAVIPVHLYGTHWLVFFHLKWLNRRLGVWNINRKKIVDFLERRVVL